VSRSQIPLGDYSKSEWFLPHPDIAVADPTSMLMRLPMRGPVQSVCARAAHAATALCHEVRPRAFNTSSSSASSALTHIDHATNNPKMVDVSDKTISKRVARAQV
jgi:hypothetical protein